MSFSSMSVCVTEEYSVFAGNCTLLFIRQNIFNLMNSFNIRTIKSFTNKIQRHMLFRDLPASASFSISYQRVPLQPVRHMFSNVQSRTSEALASDIQLPSRGHIRVYAITSQSIIFILHYAERPLCCRDKTGTFIVSKH